MQPLLTSLVSAAGRYGFGAMALSLSLIATAAPQPVKAQGLPDFALCLSEAGLLKEPHGPLEGLAGLRVDGLEQRSGEPFPSKTRQSDGLPAELDLGGGGAGGLQPRGRMKARALNPLGAMLGQAHHALTDQKQGPGGGGQIAGLEHVQEGLPGSMQPLPHP